MVKVGLKTPALRRASALVALGFASSISGCNSEFCDIQDCTGNGGSGQGGGGTGGGTPIQCELVDGQPIAASCGVFVKAGATGGNGSPAKPFGAFEDAAKKLGSKGGTIYACAGSFTGSITLPAGISVVGGVDCANGFLYDSTKSTSLTGDKDTPAILFSGGSGAGALRGFAVTAPPAKAFGGSSIGVIVNDMPFTFEHVTITTGDAKPGEQPLNQNAVPGSAGAAGGCKDMPATANAPCGGAGSPGGGGRGASQGVAAQPGDPGGAMAGTAGGDDCSPVAGIGTNSTIPGPPGVGQSTLGEISSAGFSNPPGPENAGHPGQAGGGGGGGGIKPMAMCLNLRFGGDGGNGGCGGKGGKAGNPGGSSIAIVVLGTSAPVFLDVALSVGDGGNGAEGQLGAGGGMGGPGGTGGTAGCDGGAGGNGSPGGKGGGGAGGHAVGVAHEGLTLDLGGVAMAALGAPGSGAMDGATGQSCRALSFPDGACEP